jgi:hypothetical protein
VFEPQSRYFRIPDATFEVAERPEPVRVISYKRRRFIVDPTPGPPREHRVTQGDRPDTVAARYLGDPTQFWRLCDANRVLRPSELTGLAGRSISIPVIGP